jgi:hypothetical protein
MEVRARPESGTCPRLAASRRPSRRSRACNAEKFFDVLAAATPHRKFENLGWLYGAVCGGPGDLRPDPRTRIAGTAGDHTRGERIIRGPENARRYHRFILICRRHHVAKISVPQGRGPAKPHSAGLPSLADAPIHALYRFQRIPAGGACACAPLTRNCTIRCCNLKSRCRQSMERQAGLLAIRSWRSRIRAWNVEGQQAWISSTIH